MHCRCWELDGVVSQLKLLILIIKIADFRTLSGRRREEERVRVTVKRRREASVLSPLLDSRPPSLISSVPLCKTEAIPYSLLPPQSPS